MTNRITSTTNGSAANSGGDDESAPLWCGVCGTDEYILIEMARWRRRRGTGAWDIDYTCTNCDSFYAHAVADEDITAALIAAMSVATREPAKR